MPRPALQSTEPLDCEAVIRRLWDYLDDELTPARMAAVAEHLELCERCFPEYDFQRLILETLAGLRPAGPRSPRPTFHSATRNPAQ